MIVDVHATVLQPVETEHTAMAGINVSFLPARKESEKFSSRRKLAIAGGATCIVVGLIAVKVL